MTLSNRLRFTVGLARSRRAAAKVSSMSWLSAAAKAVAHLGGGGDVGHQVWRVDAGELGDQEAVGGFQHGGVVEFHAEEGFDQFARDAVRRAGAADGLGAFHADVGDGGGVLERAAGLDGGEEFGGDGLLGAAAGVVDPVFLHLRLHGVEGFEGGGSLILEGEGEIGLFRAFDHAQRVALVGAEGGCEDGLAEGGRAGDGCGHVVGRVALGVERAGDGGDAEVPGEVVERGSGREGVLELVCAGVNLIDGAFAGDAEADVVLDGIERLFGAGDDLGDAKDLVAEGGFDRTGHGFRGGGEGGFGQFGAREFGFRGVVELDGGGGGLGCGLLDRGPVGAGDPLRGEALRGGFVLGDDDLEGALLGGAEVGFVLFVVGGDVRVRRPGCRERRCRGRG